MIFRNDPRRIVPVLFISCLFPLIAAFNNGLFERIRTVDFLLIFTARSGLRRLRYCFCGNSESAKGS